MSAVVWNEVSKRLWETGLDRGVLYLNGVPGVPWNGLISVEEAASGGELQPFFHDGVKYMDYAANETFQATLEAYTYPAEFRECDGSKKIGSGLSVTRQQRRPFGLSYRTLIGNDVDGVDYGYKLHLVYGAMTSPIAKARKTIGASIEPSTFAWSLSATPVSFPGIRPTAHFVIDSTESNPYFVQALENILYGSEDADPRLPYPEELSQMALIQDLFTVIDNGDGTWTAIDLDGEWIQHLNEVADQISAPSVVYLGDGEFTVGTIA